MSIKIALLISLIFIFYLLRKNKRLKNLKRKMELDYMDECIYAIGRMGYFRDREYIPPVIPMKAIYYGQYDNQYLTDLAQDVLNECEYEVDKIKVRINNRLPRNQIGTTSTQHKLIEIREKDTFDPEELVATIVRMTLLYYLELKGLRTKDDYRTETLLNVLTVYKGFTKFTKSDKKKMAFLSPYEINDIYTRIKQSSISKYRNYEYKVSFRR